MKHFTRLLVLASLAVAFSSAPRAEAGRVGGAAVDFGTLAPGETYAFDVPFEAGVPASVAVMGTGPSNVELLIYDGDGNVTVGAGTFERRVAVVNVYRAGYFRVVLQNTGALPATVLVGTN